WFLLGLDYWAWAITVPLLFIDWTGSWDRWRDRRAARAARAGGRSAAVDEARDELGERAPVGG
ncbi:MAG TPA: hypothetical protein VIL36_12655, partial [Acidimicrobiales bacterium]